MAGPDFLSNHRRQRRYRGVRQRRGGLDAIRFVTPIMALGFLGTIAALQLLPASSEPIGADGVPIRVVSANASHARPSGASDAAPAQATIDGRTGGDIRSARFGLCHSGGGRDCVVDGDTFWFAGEKYRIADIDTPETHPARCAEEAALGDAATRRLQAWLNAGSFSLASAGRDSDRYGRKLRVVTRGGTSVGNVLIDEGLARPWEGARRPWC